MERLTKNIKKYRQERNLTQKQLGELCGIAEPTIRRYELGKLKPKYETVQKIAAALKVDVYELYDEPTTYVMRGHKCKFSDRVCETLAAYEDTGLTPEQLRQIRIWYEELATELARYKAAIAEAAKKRQEDEIFYLFYLDCYNKGWKDAVEFIEGAIKEVTE